MSTLENPSEIVPRKSGRGSGSHCPGGKTLGVHAMFAEIDEGSPNEVTTFSCAQAKTGGTLKDEAYRKEDDG
jgi:hypothetical protein